MAPNITNAIKQNTKSTDIQPKMYLLDTSIILDDPTNIEYISQSGENMIFITDVVLSELNKKKEENSETGYFARQFFRSMHGKNGIELTQHIHAGIPIVQNDYVRKMTLKGLSDDLILYIIYRPSYATIGLDHGLNDARIAEISKDYKFTLLTNDIAFKIQALSQGIDVQSLHRDRVENPEEIDFLFSLDAPKDYEAIYFHQHTIFDTLPNWSILEVSEQDSTQESGIFSTGRKIFGLKIDGIFEKQDLDETLENTKPYVRPINLEQKLYYSILIHPKNKITVATGSTGSGKTLIALQAGIHLVKQGIVDGIIYIRNTVTANDSQAELGFRKGDEEQKLSYFMYPLYSAINLTIEKMRMHNFNKQIEYSGNVNTIHRKDATDIFLKKHRIEVYDIAHARGITIANKFVIFDEAQNASNGTVKLIGTRMGEDSRIVFLGDWTQIDHPYLSKHRNGLVSLLQKARKSDFVAGIQLRQTIRSDIASWFQDHF
jgi:PhoH-like ATPase